MTTDIQTISGIKLELDKAIPLLDTANLPSLLSQKLTKTVNEFLVMLGFESSTEIEVQLIEKADRVLQVYVKGVSQPFSFNTMRRVWQTNAPQHLRNLPDRDITSFRFPDQWLKDYLCSQDQSNELGLSRIVDILCDLAFAALHKAPSCLIGETQLQNYLTFDSDPFQVDVEYTRDVLTFLLDQGISVFSKDFVLKTIRQCYELGQSSGDAAELLFARLRCPTMELLIAPEEFKNLIGSEVPSEIPNEPISIHSDVICQASREQMAAMEEGLFWELGYYVPDLVWKIDPKMPPGLITFKTNEQSTQYSLFLTDDEILVNDTPGNLLFLKVTDAIRTLNPASDKSHSVVSATYKDMLIEKGYTTWDRFGYVVLLTAGEIKKRASQYFTVDDATYHLDQIRKYVPKLVEHALRRFTTYDIARILRTLLSERISIRDMRSILESLLQYGSISADENRLIIFDERLPIAPHSTVLRPESPRSYYEFARVGLKRQISSGLWQGRNVIPKYQLEPELEDWLVEINMSEQEDLQELDDCQYAIRQGIWAEIVQGTETMHIILTTKEPRASLQEIIYREMPNIIVVAYSELVPELSLQTISIIRTPEIVSKSIREKKIRDKANVINFYEN
jgi:FHIPEP family